MAVSPHPVPPPVFVTPKGSCTGAHRGVLAGSGGPEGNSHSCCLKGGWDRRTEIKIRKRKRGQRISIASWIWGRRKVGGGPGPHQCPQYCARIQRLWVAPSQSPTHPLPPAVGEVLPEQQPQLGAHGHCGDRGPRSAPAAGESRGRQPQTEGNGWTLTSFCFGVYHTPGTVPGTGLSSRAGRSRTAFLQQSSFPELKAQITFLPKAKAPELGMSSIQGPGARFTAHAGLREQSGTPGVVPGELGSPGEAETCPCLSFPVRGMWVGLSSAQEQNCSGAVESGR